jgi:hypothetical protein
MKSQKVNWPEVQKVLDEQPVQQVVVADYVVEIGSIHGGLLSIAPPGQRVQDRARPRPEPPRILPRPIPFFVDREEEQRLLASALENGQPVHLYGPDGIGKTTLVRQVMHDQPTAAFPDGIVYLAARDLTYVDLLQDLFELFFETEMPIRITEGDARRHLADKRALIVIDDADNLEGGDAEALVQVLPNASLLVVSREQQMWDGVAVELQGLPVSSAVALFEAALGHLSVESRLAVEAICRALDGVPLAIQQAVATFRQSGLSLDQVRQQVQSIKPEHDQIAHSLQSAADRLTAEERRVVAGLAASGGATVDKDALSAITALPVAELDRYLHRLQQMNLLQADEARFTLADGFKPAIQEPWIEPAMEARAAEYYVQRAEQILSRPGDPDEDNVMSAIKFYFSQGKWTQVVAIARTAERFLITTGRWRQWKLRLGEVLLAANELNDWKYQAWAHHQLGIVAMEMEDGALAREQFENAYAIRQAHDDREGLAVTQRNLELLAIVAPGVWMPDRARPVPTGPVEMNYNMAAIRRLLLEAFTPQDLRRFCQDRRLFRPIVYKFSPQHGLEEMVGRVIDHCWNEFLWDDLLEAVAEEKPRQYARFEPYLYGPGQAALPPRPRPPSPSSSGRP